jgi:hypothetical protein
MGRVRGGGAGELVGYNGRIVGIWRDGKQLPGASDGVLAGSFL